MFDGKIWSHWQDLIYDLFIVRYCGLLLGHPVQFAVTCWLSRLGMLLPVQITRSGRFAFDCWMWMMKFLSFRTCLFRSSRWSRRTHLSAPVFTSWWPTIWIAPALYDTPSNQACCSLATTASQWRGNDFLLAGQVLPFFLISPLPSFLLFLPPFPLSPFSHPLP